MRLSSAVLFALMFLVVSTISSSFAQLPWTKDPNNPVLSGGTSGAWNHYLFWPSVLYNPDSARYEMWYSGSAGSPLRPMNIGFAYSPDGITWTKLDTAVLKPDPGSWDESSVEGPWVIREDGGTYKMWYSGSNSVNDNWSIGYATSSDGINWTKHPGNPVMTQGPAAWEAGGVTVGSVLYNEDSTRYDMWYGGYTAAAIGNIGYATSTDGITWTKLDTAVLNNGGSGTWDEDAMDLPHVLYLDGTYHMWFAGIPQSYNPPWQIGWATSVDGIHWNKYNDPSTTSQFYSESDPVLKPDNGQWDGSRLEAGTVMRIGDTLHFWYTGVLNPPSQNLWRIGHATAPYTMPTTIRVPEDLPTIQAAIDSAADGNLVLVADGTYRENINFKGKAITVASHFYIDGDTSHISNTVIDGSNPSNPDSGSVVSFISGEDTTSVIYGFTITGGTGTIVENNYQGAPYLIRAGGGILCYNSGACISNNKIMNNDIPNYLFAGGGGIAGYPNGSADYVIIESNQILNNTVAADDQALGCAVELNFYGKLIDNVISHNMSTGNNIATGGVACWSENQPRTVMIINNQITHNVANGNQAIGGGVDIESTMNASITGNKISDNELNTTDRGRGGGISLYFHDGNSNRLITNNIISGNSASNGGGIYSQESNTQIINNTIVNNTASTNGGGLLETVANPPRIVNTILWGNQAPINPQISGTPAVRYSNIQGGFTGEGNIDADPFFADTLLYNLSDSSLCIGAGIDSINIGGTWYHAPLLDFDGDPRPLSPGSLPDIGAQESPLDFPGGIEVLEMNNIPETYSLSQNYPNPFNPTTNIEFSIHKSEFVTLKVYNVLGEEVATLISKRLTLGKYKYDWDASDLASGVYLYRIQAGNYVEAKKMVLIR